MIPIYISNITPADAEYGACRTSKLLLTLLHSPFSILNSAFPSLNHLLHNDAATEPNDEQVETAGGFGDGELQPCVAAG